MNTNFETMIRSALADGMTFDDIAGLFARNLNEVQKQESPEEKRKKRIVDLYNQFQLADASKQVTIGDVAALATVVMAKANPNWTLEQVDYYCENVLDFMKTCASAINNPMKELMNALGNVLEHLGCTDRDDEDEDTCNHDGECDCDKNCHDVNQFHTFKRHEPDDIIKAFLRTLDN